MANTTKARAALDLVEANLARWDQVDWVSVPSVIRGIPVSLEAWSERAKQLK